ncbi:hypothetical protein [Sulfitobacter sp. G21635-S1]|jgi:hypothetical protein|uniref:hypothetical protein n=1 Tax=Sulfitobacter sp. G21635-S1 TaxID=3014043 RepID=UPI0022AF46F2|nr:hypothetical protein [Sulfitobacter sp. G21635-S1]
MPTIKGAPLVRPAGRRWPGACGLFRTLACLIDGGFVRLQVFRAAVGEDPESALSKFL